MEDLQDEGWFYADNNDLRVLSGFGVLGGGCDANVALEAGARFVVRLAGDDFFRRTIVGSDESANNGPGQLSRADETKAVTIVGCL